jgi:tripartite-type tricarboxylate transporter receptor subunit TctC
VATVNPEVPVKTLKELVEYGRANPGKLNYLNPGNGSSIHLSAELLKHQYKFDMTSVPYRGIPPGLPDLLEGRLQVGLLPGPLALQHVQSGKLRALAVLASQRLPALPDVPTFAEAGFADAQVMSWYTIAVRAGTPGAIVERLHGSAMKALQSAETRDRLTRAGCEVPAPRSPADVLAMWKADYTRYGKLVKDAGIKGES